VKWENVIDPYWYTIPCLAAFVWIFQDAFDKHGKYSSLFCSIACSLIPLNIYRAYCECFINGMPNILVVKVTSPLVVDTLKVFTASFFRFHFEPTLGTMRLRAVPFILKKWYLPSFCIDPAIICGVNILALHVNAPATK
jgi:hypothetical protein